MVAFSHFCALLLWIHSLTFVQNVKAQSCTLEGFKRSGLFDENFDLTTLDQSYNSGDNVRVRCKVGFRGFFKLICSNGQWFNRGDKCKAISCGHPGDVQFADFRLVQGDDYVFGSQVLYTCHRGYQMTSFTNTRNCLEGGWDGHLPECEPIMCQPVTLTANNRVLVNGDMEQPQSGSVLQFRCTSPDDVLEGPTQIVCDEYGNWDRNPPRCKELTCLKPESPTFQVHGDKLVYRKDEVVGYTCIPRYIKRDGRPSVCRKVGQSAEWAPMPHCEPIKCKLSANPPAGTEYSPRNEIIFDPGRRVRVTCGDKHYVKSREFKSAELTCQDTGKWDSEPPVCQPVTCSRHAPNVYDWQRDWYGDNTVFMDQTLWYRCHRDFKATGQTEDRGTARCTRGGWEPNPLCTEKGCPKPKYRNAEISDNYQKDEYEHSERVRFRCTYDDPIVEFEYLCRYGEWIYSTRDFPQPRCKEQPCPGPPSLDNGEMLPNQREQEQYEHGDSLQFKCIGETYPFRVNCEKGRWTTHKRCQNVGCTEPPRITNAEIVGRPKRQYGHKETVDMRCTTRPEQTFTVSCQSGQWSPEHQCPECGIANIDHGYSYEHENKLYYACNDGYKLRTKGWWGVASCESGQWTTVECVASTNCGPLPDIPHMIVKSDGASDGESLTIRCETGHTEHQNLRKLTCTKGKWNFNGVKLNQICTPILRKCHTPLKINNAVITAPFEKEYSSGISLTYKCRDNYVMDGDGTVQCNNGTWEEKNNIICERRSSTEMPEQ